MKLSIVLLTSHSTSWFQRYLNRTKILSENACWWEYCSLFESQFCLKDNSDKILLQKCIGTCTTELPKIYWVTLRTKKLSQRNNLKVLKAARLWWMRRLHFQDIWCCQTLWSHGFKSHLCHHHVTSLWDAPAGGLFENIRCHAELRTNYFIAIFIHRESHGD